VRYYDEDGALERTITFHDFRTMGGRLVPSTMLVVPADEPGESTRLIYHELEFDVPLEAEFFSLRNLRARGG
ncbi:MAG TPA: outer membrane lipoprotein-sorting protein, partial [Longimicrobiales bacterium]|nr:outer membrane lipoprotein-sorting protein [Longimicrobiales bacterium]